MFYLLKPLILKTVTATRWQPCHPLTATFSACHPVTADSCTTQSHPLALCSPSEGVRTHQHALLGACLLSRGQEAMGRQMHFPPPPHLGRQPSVPLSRMVSDTLYNALRAFYPSSSPWTDPCSQQQSLCQRSRRAHLRLLYWKVPLGRWGQDWHLGAWISGGFPHFSR